MNRLFWIRGGSPAKGAHSFVGVNSEKQVISTIARLTIDEYDRMINSGVFENRRIELIHGELREMSPIGVPHEYAVDELNEWSIQNVPLDRVRVRIQHSIGLPELNSVPQPDVS